jgi:hypothetical protein
VHMDRSEIALIALAWWQFGARYLREAGMTSAPLYASVKEILAAVAAVGLLECFGKTERAQEKALRTCLARNESGFFERAPVARSALFRIRDEHWDKALRRCNACGYGFEISGEYVHNAAIDAAEPKRSKAGREKRHSETG